MITFVGGSAVGGFDHIKPLLAARAAGVQDLSVFNYVSFDGGGPALIEVKSGRADVFTGDTSEVLGDLDANLIKIIAVFAPNKVARLGDAPTAASQGYDIVAGNYAIQQVAGSDEWSTLREENGLAPFESYGMDFENFAKSQIEILTGISKELGIID